jgi:hypothetical protein
MTGPTDPQPTLIDPNRFGAIFPNHDQLTWEFSPGHGGSTITVTGHIPGRVALCSSRAPLIGASKPGRPWPTFNDRRPDAWKVRRRR